VDRRIERLTSTAHQAVRDGTPDGERLRRRAAAGAGLSLMVAGFLVAVGFGLVVFVVLGALIAVGAALTAIPLVGHARGRVRVPQVRVPRPHKIRVPRPRMRFPRPQVEPARRALSVGARTAGRRATDLADSGKKLASRRPAGSRQRQQEAVRLNARGVRSRRSGDPELAVESHEAALAILHELGDRRGEALTLNSLALALEESGLDDVALDHFHRALAILRELDDDYREGQVVANLGFVHARRGRRLEALECLRAALEKLTPESHEYRRVEEHLRRAS
jgi:hypothetical protein